jgi:DNA-binding PadR family transcriptional regulator
MLRELLEAGHLSCATQVVDGKRRKNYLATASGRRLLAAAREKLRELASEIVEDRDAMQARRRRGKTASEAIKPRRGR